MKWGSSPLARGPPRTVQAGAGDLGLIPARAGTTFKLKNRYLVAQAHPRSRGDHTAARFAVAVTAGSSPLARGPRRENHIEPGHGGLIPARAGTTVWRIGMLLCPRAHPRSRGDHMNTDRF